MPAYLVKLDQTKGGYHLQQNANAMVIFAHDATAALQMAAAQFAGSEQIWLTDGTATEIVAGVDWNGWTFTVNILSGFGAGNDEPASVSVLGDATTNTLDEIGAALAVKLNALAGIAGAAYDAPSDTLTIAAIGDGLGDQTVQVFITPPNGQKPVPGIVGTITHQGIAGAALTAVLKPGGGEVVPNVVSYLKLT